MDEYYSSLFVRTLFAAIWEISEHVEDVLCEEGSSELGNNCIFACWTVVAEAFSTDYC